MRRLSTFTGKKGLDLLTRLGKDDILLLKREIIKVRGGELI